MIRVLAVVSALALAACGPNSDPPGDDENPVTTLTVAPALSTLTSVDGAEVAQDFTVRATYADGEIADVTALVAWSVPSAFGRMEGPRFITTGRIGGVATVTASLDDALGTAQVEVNVRATVIDPSAPANAPDLFAGATVDPGRAPTLVYPPDNVVVPSNLGAFDVHWSDASANDVWEISIHSAHSDVRVYVGATYPRWFQFSPLQWMMASTNDDSVIANVRGAQTTAPGVIGEATPRTAFPADAPIEGGLYYWASGSDGACAGRCGIYRHDLAQPEMAAEPYYTSVEAGRCVACHALSRDGTRMAVTYDGGDGAGSMIDVASRTAAPTPGNWNYATYTPNADRLITALNGYLDIRDPLAGTVVGQIPTGQFASQPDFSPNGNFIAYAGNPAIAVPVYNVSFGGANIVVQPYDGASYGTPVNVVTSAGENNYYPSVSPDGSWIAFNRSTGDSYDDVDAEVWAVPSVGGTPMRLDTANIQTGLYNSWVRWAPFEQTVNGERMYWLTFSSRRQFGVRLAQNTRPQVWMAAFFPDRAAAGIDPTAPAFWLPFQDITTNNHIAQWAEQVIPIE
jgi:hypothetical protein